MASVDWTAVGIAVGVSLFVIVVAVLLWERHRRRRRVRAAVSAVPVSAAEGSEGGPPSPSEEQAPESESVEPPQSAASGGPAVSDEKSPESDGQGLTSSAEVSQAKERLVEAKDQMEEQYVLFMRRMQEARVADIEALERSISSLQQVRRAFAPNATEEEVRTAQRWFEASTKALERHLKRDDLKPWKPEDQEARDAFFQKWIAKAETRIAGRKERRGGRRAKAPRKGKGSGVVPHKTKVMVAV